MPSAKLVYSTPLQLAVDAMSNCYGNKCTTKSLLKAVNAGHLSLLEHVTATFDIMCSEAVLKQISRHRHLSPTVESSRGSDITANRFYIHDKALEGKTLETYEDLFGEGEYTWVTEDAGKTINEVYQMIVNMYDELIFQGVSKEVAAYILPMATQVKMRYTGNLRAWFEYLQKRLCKRASIEHRELAEAIYNELNKTFPDVFNKETLNICKGCKEHGCSF